MIIITAIAAAAAVAVLYALSGCRGVCGDNVGTHKLNRIVREPQGRREQIDFGEFDMEGARFRKRRERELFGNPEPLRKAVGLFSNEAAQKCVR